MSSLLFWGPYLTHKAIVGHRRDKKRQQNYERWEGLRDEYDDMKRVTAQRQSLDYQATGYGGSPYYDSDGAAAAPRHSLSNDRDLFTLRDQQEAGDARMSWTPQERWEQNPNIAQAASSSSSRLSLPSTIPSVPHYLQPQRTSSQAGPLVRQKTGATWDEGLPAPLRVSRRQFNDNGTPIISNIDESGADGSWTRSTNSSRQDITRASSGRRSRTRSESREDEERRKRETAFQPEVKNDSEVIVVESPYEWWK